MRNKSKMKDKTIYVTKGTYGDYEHSVIWFRGKELMHDKYYYIKESSENDPSITLIKLFEEIEWWKKLGYNIVFDNFLDEDDLKELEETKKQLKKEREVNNEN